MSEVWGEDIAERYDRNHAPMFSAEALEPALDLLTDLADGEPLLEFAIGTGRVAVPLQQRGVSVTGIELSKPMVAKLRAKATPEEIPVVIGDMATATAPGVGSFGVAYLVYNTITNLLTQDGQVECFANAARHLRPGGSFVIECYVPVLRRLPPGQLAAPFDVTEDHLGFDTYDLVAQHLVSHHFWREDDDRFLRSAGTFRYVWPTELDLMARLAGMTLVNRFADWTGAPFTNESTSHVSVWQKANS